MNESDPDPSESDLQIFKPHPDYIKIKRTISWLRAGVLFAIVAFVAMILLLTTSVKVTLIVVTPLGGLLLPIAIWFAVRWPDLFEKHHNYILHPEGMEIQAGILWQRSVFIPHSRLQHADVVQGPLERNHDLANLAIFTAGSRHAKTLLKGLAHADALALSKQLTFTLADAVEPEPEEPTQVEESTIPEEPEAGLIEEAPAPIEEPENDTKEPVIEAESPIGVSETITEPEEAQVLPVPSETVS